MGLNICAVTSSRSDYGLLKPLFNSLKDDNNICLKIVATGSHLSSNYGLTFRQIIKDGFQISAYLETIDTIDNIQSIAKAMNLTLSKFVDYLIESKPDILLLLGDRYEIFSAATAATLLNIPIAHIHGGETTEGAFDNAFRNAITKMSRYHFVASQEFANQVIKMGEASEKVFNVGALGIDALASTKLLSKNEIEQKLNIQFLDKILLITYHPETLSAIQPKKQIEIILQSLNSIKNTTLVFTLPNADTQSNSIIDQLNKFVSKHPHAYLFDSLGHELYFSLANISDAIIGNSSSGIIEIPYLRKYTLNIGNRQKGRPMAMSVINVELSANEISSSIGYIYKNKDSLGELQYKLPYGESGASVRIHTILKQIGHSLSVS